MKKLCAVNDIPEGGSKGFDIGDGHSCFAVRHDDQIYVYRNRCPHLGVELEWVEDQFLDADGALIQCATHGALFLIDNGHCVGGPCLGESLQAMTFVIEQGDILLSGDGSDLLARE